MPRARVPFFLGSGQPRKHKPDGPRGRTYEIFRLLPSVLQRAMHYPASDPTTSKLLASGSGSNTSFPTNAFAESGY